MTQLGRFTHIALIGVMITSLTACSGEDRKKVAQASDDLARGISTALALDDALIKQKLISNEDAVALTSAILDVNRIAKELNDRARSYKSLDAKAKADLLNIVGDLTAGLAKLNTQGVLKIKNPASQAQFQAALAILQSATAVLTAVLTGGQK